MRARFIASTVLAGLAGWLVLRAPEPLERPARSGAPAPAPPAEPEVQAPKTVPGSPRVLPAPVVVPARAFDEQHAHPLTSEHEYLRGRTALIAQLNDALDLRDAVSLRALIDAYELEDPEDTQRLAEGYERVADCIEHPQDSASRANAQRYYDDARASSVRRYVRRICLGDDATLSQR